LNQSGGGREVQEGSDADPKKTAALKKSFNREKRLDAEKAGPRREEKGKYSPRSSPVLGRTFREDGGRALATSKAFPLLLLDRKREKLERP